jgi:hypothetical protein
LTLPADSFLEYCLQFVKTGSSLPSCLNPATILSPTPREASPQSSITFLQDSYYYYDYYYYCSIFIFILTKASNVYKYSTTFLENVSKRAPNRNFRDFRLFSVDFRHHACPSIRCASGASAFGRDTDLFDGNSVSINDLLVSVVFAM